MSQSSGKYTILVNSTDSFEDCWIPFFTLLKAYWPNCEQPIVLNTETKDFSFPGLNITCSKVGKGREEKRLPWGWCLLECLDHIETETILYLQEDYFLEGPVDHAQIDEFVEILNSLSSSRQDCKHIGLTHFGSHSPFHLTEHPLLWEIDQLASYRISLQAGLWQKSNLAQYVRPNDTGWQLEEVGSLRARRIHERLLTVNRHIFNPSGRLIFPYTHTGIIRGKWNRDAVEGLFQQHGLSVDFSKRGFYAPDHINSSNSTSAIITDWLYWKCRNGLHRLNGLVDRVRNI